MLFRSDGDIRGNAEKVRQAHDQAESAGADIVFFPELFLSGYSPDDLVLKPAFMDAIEDAVHALALKVSKSSPAIILPSPWRFKPENSEPGIGNAVLVLDEGGIQQVRFKHDLPNYSVFDEKRIFTAGPLPQPVIVRGVSFGLPICQDCWSKEVIGYLFEKGAEIILGAHGSPFEEAKGDVRLAHMIARTKETSLPLVYLNLVGGQDDVVYDGASFVLDRDGVCAMRLPSFAEHIALTHWQRDALENWQVMTGDIVPEDDRLSAMYKAMMLGLCDYVRKNHFSDVLIGMSGGIDSALCAAVAVDALGASNVHCVMMPSVYTSKESLEDAAAACRLLNVTLEEISIVPAVNAFEQMLTPLIGAEPGLTQENIQSRIRGMTLMALSNKLGYMVLSTGNKSEMMVGYATLYGDMCGGYSVLKDVYKTDVFALARWRNNFTTDSATNRGAAFFLGQNGPVMPKRILEKAPSAELRENQKDMDSLPPYEILDAVLQKLVEREMSVEDIVACGYDTELVRHISQMLDRAEYKRRQAPPGVKLTSKALGRERRYPITNGFCW